MDHANPTVALFEQLNNAPISEWTYIDSTAVNDQFENKSATSSRNWKREGRNGSTSFVVKCEMTIPHIEPEALFDLLANN